MKKYISKSYPFFFLISLLSLLYIRYYEKTLYYKPINKFLDLIYSYIAIPTFYYFIAAGITILIIGLFKINVSETLKTVSKYTVVFSIIIYIIFLLLNIIGFKIIPLICFTSIYSILFSLLGCLFAFTIKIKI